MDRFVAACTPPLLGHVAPPPLTPSPLPRRRWGLFAPGIIGLAVGAIIFLLIKDDPETAGFAPVEAAHVKKGAPR